MSVFKVQGQQTPRGRVRVSGAKNAATRMMAAALLTEEEVILTNFPTELVDVRHKGNYIQKIGGSVLYDSENERVSIHASSVDSNRLDHFDYPIRTTYLLVAGQVARVGYARIPYPGGCKLGERKHDLHLMVWRALGCEVFERQEYIEVLAPVGGFVGGDINFPITTVGGTENAILCGVLASGKTCIHNAYVTPEITNLIEMLIGMGASIDVNGASLIVINGVDFLRGVNIRVIPDRIEAITWIVYAALTKGDVLIENVPFAEMNIPLKHLRDAGINYFRNDSSIYISPNCFTPYYIQPFEVACGTHPGIISDMQVFFVLLALVAQGNSTVFDYRYPERVRFFEELVKFFPDNQRMCWSSDSVAKVWISGPVLLREACVTSTDLRGSMGLVIAALIAKGNSSVDKVEMAFRGYNDLEGKLRSLGIVFELIP